MKVESVMKTTKKNANYVALTGFALALAGLASGCSGVGARHTAATEFLTEESRALTTAVVDSLQNEPASARTVESATALHLARQDQRLEGLPKRPIETPALLGASALGTNGVLGPKPEGRGIWRGLRERFDRQDAALARQREAAGELQELGARTEEARNRRTAFWSRWLALLGTAGGGLVALIVLVPVAGPILGRLIGALVARIPAAAGWFGVVGVKAFDAVVRGVERAKGAALDGAAAPSTLALAGSAGSARLANDIPRRAPQGDAPWWPALAGQLSRSLDDSHKRLVRRRRSAVVE